MVTFSKLQHFTSVHVIQMQLKFTELIAATIVAAVAVTQFTQAGDSEKLAQVSNRKKRTFQAYVVKRSVLVLIAR